MEAVCDQFWFCNTLLPWQWHWLLGLMIPMVAIVLLGVPVANILHRTGHSRWWTVLAYIPLVNLICLWVFAFGRWPAVDSK
jgi:hypothetical protein